MFRKTFSCRASKEKEPMTPDGRSKTIRGKSGSVWMVVWLALFVVGLIPILFIAFYNFPCADDFGFSTYARLAWIDTHNIFSVFAGAAKKTAELWHSWQGTYTSIFLMALQPGIFGDRFYCLTPWLMIGALTASLFLLFDAVFHDCFGAQRRTVFSMTLMCLLVSVNTLVDRTQGLYWYNGAVHYMLPQAALFTLTGLLIKMAVDTGKKKIGRMIAAILLVFYIGGGNLITGLECGIWLAIAFLILWLVKRCSACLRVGTLFVFWVLFFGINALAPGNQVRQMNFTARPGVILSVLESFFYCLEYVLGEWSSWIVWMYLLLLIPFVLEILQDHSDGFSFPCPAAVLALSFCILSSMFTPSVYASGNPGAGRIFNVIYLTFLLLITFDLFYLTGWCLHRYGARVEKKKLEAGKLCGLAAFLFCAALFVKAKPEEFTASAALQSLVSGEAASYRAQQEVRLEQLLDDTVDDAVLMEFTVKPQLLFYEDIEEDPEGWKNVRMRDYYRKHSVRLQRNAAEEG